MSEFDVSYIGAAGAGLLSFLSPCVLPLVPAYLCFLGGVSLEELTDTEAAGTERAAVTGRVVLAALAFVVGFSVVFVSFGATASALSQLILEYKLVLGKIAGAVIILFGLHFMGLFRLAVLNREVRFHPNTRPAGLIGAFLLGLAFAFGWTPCIGPVLATVLTVAAQADSVAYGSSLLTAYAAGLGVPFLLAAFLARPFMSLMRRFRRHVQKIEFAVGALLVVTGLLFIFNSFKILGFTSWKLFRSWPRSVNFSAAPGSVRIFLKKLETVDIHVRYCFIRGLRSLGTVTIDMQTMRGCARPASSLLKAMSNERRLMILCHLMEGEKSVGQLEGLIGISQSALSQHLARLRRDNLVATRREVQSIYYSLSGRDVPVIVDALQGVFAR